MPVAFDQYAGHTNPLAKAESGHRLQICIGTMNVGMKAPPDNLDPWIPKGGGGFDLIVVGVQECSFRTRPAYVVAGGISDHEEDEEDEDSLVPCTRRSLSQTGAKLPEADATGASAHDRRFINLVAQHVGTQYVPVDTVALMNMRLVVFVHVDHQDEISSIEKTTEATGIGRVVGNKGAVLVSTGTCVIEQHTSSSSTHLQNHILTTFCM
jgi:hypothetical protein